VAGPADMRRRVNQAIAAAIRRQQEPEQIRANATTMRGRMARDLRPHGPWDVKLRPGGLIDIEFIAQVLQLVQVRDPAFRGSQTTHVALRRLGEAGAISKPDVRVLVDAERLWRTIQGMLRMTVGRVEVATLPHASALPLLRAAAKAGVAAGDAEDLLRKSDDIARQVRMMFERYVGKPG
jgi:[glutamine synthetase] adenylyltransferase / [glutamine synthetase]-adenylyl-L-tyrosine phosphorylase